MKLLIALLQVLTPLHIYAQQATGKEISGTYAPGIYHNRNFVKNPGAEKNVLYTTNSASIVTRTTSTPIMGTASFLIDGTSSGQTVKFDTDTLDNNLKGQNCEGRFTFTGDATLYKAYIEQGSTKVTADLTLTNETNARDVSIAFPCGDLSSNSHIVIETTSASAAAIKVDDVYLGKETVLKAGIAINNFSAKVSSAGAVSEENQDFISGNCSVANTSEYTCTWTSGFFTASPNCTAIGLDTSTAAPIAKIFTQATTTSIVIKTYNNSAAATAYAFVLSCQRGSSDFLQQAISPNNWNYNPTAFTPSTVGSQGFGTIAAESCFHQRTGRHMVINCKITAGTVAASEARITLPNSNTISSTEVPAIRLLEGYWIRSTATGSTVKRGTILGNGGNTYINFSNDDYTGTVNPLVAQNGSAIFSNSDVISFYARIPITGWSENQNAPILVGSITSSSTGAGRYSYIELNYCGTNGTCPTPISATPDVSSVTRLSTGTFDINFVAGSYSSKPVCSYSANSQNVFAQFSTFSSNALRMTVRSTAAGTGTDADGQVICIGPR